MIKWAQKHLASVIFSSILVLFVVFLRFLPIEVAGMPVGMSPTRIINSLFLAATIALLFGLSVTALAKKEYVENQILTFIKYRHLLVLMVKRDFVTRYKRSVLGVLWSLLNPLLTMLVLTMVFSFVFRFDIPNFPVFLLSGQLVMNFFAESTNGALGSIIGGASTIRKIYVPKYIFPIAKVLSALINVAFSFIAFMLVFVITGADFHWTLLLVPIPVFYTFLFAMGIGMLLSALAVFFRDLTYIYSVFLTLLTFLTPIFYPVSILPERVFHLIHLNPMFHFVEYFRALALYGYVPGLWSNIICLGFVLMALCLGLYAKITQQDKYILHL